MDDSVLQELLKGFKSVETTVRAELRNSKTAQRKLRKEISDLRTAIGSDVDDLRAQLKSLRRDYMHLADEIRPLRQEQETRAFFDGSPRVSGARREQWRREERPVAPRAEANYETRDDLTKGGHW